MAKGFDCATPLTLELAQKFKADGYEFVARYLVPNGWKRLTVAEAKLISAAGLQIVTVFETTADRALGGKQAGLEDGAIAERVAAEVGQLAGSCIYFAVDFDATPEQMAVVIDYIRGASEATPNYKTGVYGSYAVIMAAIDANACSRFWQTYAWSGGRFTSHSNIFQHQNDIEENGIGVDLNTSYGNEGWWSLKKEDEPMLLKDDANDIIDSYLSKEWAKCEKQRKKAEKQGRADDEKAWRDLRDHQKYLANQLRKASGQPEQ